MIYRSESEIVRKDGKRVTDKNLDTLFINEEQSHRFWEFEHETTFEIKERENENFISRLLDYIPKTERLLFEGSVYTVKTYYKGRIDD